MPLTIGLLGSVLLINVDVVMAYFIFSPAVNGVYAASALLAKAIVTATQPVIQTMIPVITRVEREPIDKRLVTQKAIGIAVALGSVGVIFLWMAAPQLCGGQYGIQHCDLPIMGLLALSAIPLIILRALVVANASYKRRGIAEVIYVAVAAVVFAALASSNVHSLAAVYCVSCWAALGLCCLPHFARAIVRKNRN